MTADTLEALKREILRDYPPTVTHLVASVVDRCFAALVRPGGVPQPETEPQWQSIETAPKDGTTILVFKHTPPAWNVIGLAFWFGGDSSISGWISYGIPQHSSEANTLGLAFPTHWMPLPDIPREDRP